MMKGLRCQPIRPAAASPFQLFERLLIMEGALSLRKKMSDLEEADWQVLVSGLWLGSEKTVFCLGTLGDGGCG